MAAAVAAASLHPDTDTDPRELEAFAERFKQRRIKLGKHLTRNSIPIDILKKEGKKSLCNQTQKKPKLSLIELENKIFVGFSQIEFVLINNNNIK